MTADSKPCTTHEPQSNREPAAGLPKIGKAFVQGYRAGHRNRRLGMGRPRIAGTVLYATPHETFCDRQYGIGYIDGWHQADFHIRQGAARVHPAAENREMLVGVMG